MRRCNGSQRWHLYLVVAAFLFARPSTPVRDLLSWLGSRPVLLHLVPGVVALRIRSSPQSLSCQARICAFGSEPDVDHPGATYELGRAAADQHAWAGSGL
jgi:hypothetical protein